MAPTRMSARRGASAAALLAALSLLALLAGAGAAPAKNVRTSVVIVGAGISGIRAAAVLADGGVSDFVVLEATSKIGGRMRNTEIAPGQFVELGANWVQGLKGNPIYDLALSCGVAGTLQNWDSIITFDEFNKPLPDSQIPWKQFDTAVKCVSSTVQNDITNGVYGGDIDARAALRVCGWNPVKPVEHAVEWYTEEFEWAETSEMISAQKTHPKLCYVDFQDADLMIHDQTGGMAKIVQCVANRSNVTDLGRVKLNTPVVSFDVTGSNTVLVKTASGVTYEADYVINTMPIAAMQRALGTLFPASLMTPARKAALMQFRMATYTKIFLKFDSQFWDPNTQFIMQVPDRTESYQVLWQSLSPANQGFLPGSNIIFMTLTDIMGAFIESLPDWKVLDIVISRLQQIYPAANTTSKLVGYVIPRWYTNDYFGGSFTNHPAGMTDAQYNTWRAPMGTPLPFSTPGKILFAGEAACRRMNGYMSGGYAAGERAANQILQGMGKFSGDPDNNLCERQLTLQGKPLGQKAHGSGRGGVTA